jgi:hypothetical protein
VKTDQWQWMMNWCKSQQVSPANKHFWDKAKEEYEKVMGADNEVQNNS